MQGVRSDASTQASIESAKRKVPYVSAAPFRRFFIGYNLRSALRPLPSYGAPNNCVVRLHRKHWNYHTCRPYVAWLHRVMRPDLGLAVTGAVEAGAVETAAAAGVSIKHQ
ncbi:hypothetical protein PPTG_22613 [Phytophthora nicotianae INRA-310]|uniref:Uncharacterized protein n=1 Tax=Phytophthora nicotianae (strain INRA-310) TaxID=761204 RepID=W2QCR1_PHYN3|nr:hypothetical protein PPTG_22613 [Phytophthora nicotianae INRA-310]ETN10947.1 hypothetical protein PPTG_22613 [Phytophthora nicotianae INRA-310]